MAETPRNTRAEEFLLQENLLKRNAFLLINEMLTMSQERPSVLVDEILHSIFFLGEINTPKYSPADIVSDQDMLNKLKGTYPQPFKFYTSRLPRRSPMSCVLDMTVNLLGQEQENEIITSLHKLNVKLREGNATEMISSTICISKKDKTTGPGRHYGVSMSTSGRNPGRVVTGAACLSKWDSYVESAVITYYPKREKKSYFDGTIKMPVSVRCDAFSLANGKPMAACRSCGNLFGLTTSETKEWAYGNCAEVESLSNLLKNEQALKESVRPQSKTYTKENIEKAENSTNKELKDSMRMMHFQWDQQFYTPQI